MTKAIIKILIDSREVLLILMSEIEQIKTMSVLLHISEETFIENLAPNLTS